ncbi:hypothetical protein SCUP515_04343 [Seiridium cupressi]
MSSRSEWRTLRPRSKEWYIDQNLTILGIVDMLRDNGKVTTQRTVREMLKELGLFKKRKPDDMRTALHLLAQLGYTDALMPPGDFPVQIRDTSVPFKTIRNYYRRKNIYTPFAWLRTHPQDDFMPNSNVGLFPDFAPDSDNFSPTLCVVLSPVLSSLLKYFAEAAEVFLPRNHPISGMFSRLYSLLRHSHAENVLAYSLRATEVLLNIFNNHHIKTLDTTSYWKLLYLKERYCDSLYHAQGSPDALRRQLLEEQERFYSPTSSNVLWTLTNVADDSLRGDRLSEAEMLYETALMRAESHAPYSRAKTRFAALEGLARVARRKAQKTENEIALVSPGRGGVTSGDLCRIRYEYLQTADVLLGRACNEAQTFGSGNRRFIRVSKQHAIVQRESMAIATKDTKGCRVKSDTGVEKHS